MYFRQYPAYTFTNLIYDELWTTNSDSLNCTEDINLVFSVHFL